MFNLAVEKWKMHRDLLPALWCCFPDIRQFHHPICYLSKCIRKDRGTKYNTDYLDYILFIHAYYFA